MINIRVIQPPYPYHPKDVDASVNIMTGQLAACDSSLDLVLLPEGCNAPCGCGDSAVLAELTARNTERLLNAARETAARCGAVVGINLYVREESVGKLRNATLLFDRRGELAAKYDKIHLPISEFSNPAIDHSYIERATGPTVAELDGVRYAFMTCYDMYYVEMASRVALERPDVILVCSLQRGERAEVLETEAKSYAFLCNAFVVRSSYSMGPESGTGGNSLVAAPDGTIVRNLGQRVGSLDCAVEDIRCKFSRPNSYGQPNVPNDVFQTLFRAPWTYRAAGGGVRPGDKATPFPRLCARGGFAPGAPRDTLPSLALAVAMGARELELNVQSTRDGELIVCREPRVVASGGVAKFISEMTAEEVRRLNPGGDFSPAFDGVGYAGLEEAFANFPRRTLFNLRLDGHGGGPTPEDLVRKVAALAGRYDCREHIYLASGDADVLRAALSLAPDIGRCLIVRDGGPAPHETLERARACGCSRIQAGPYALTDELIRSARAADIRCGLDSCDDPKEARAWLEKGVDCILTDNYLKMSQALAVK